MAKKIFSLTGILVFLGIMMIFFGIIRLSAETFRSSFAMAIIGMGIIFFGLVFLRFPKSKGGGGEWQRFVEYGIGWRENKGRKNPWPKRRLD